MSGCAFTFEGLPGVAGGRLLGVPRHSITAMIEALRWHRLVWTTGDDGRNIIVYRDDARRLRCFYHHRLTPQAVSICRTANDARAWLAVWFPMLRDPTRAVPEPASAAA